MKRLKLLGQSGDMRATPIRGRKGAFIVIVGLICCSLVSSSMAGNIRIRIGGRGFFKFRGNLPTAALAEMFKPGKLKFQENVLRGDVARASRYVKQQFVDEAIKGYPPLFYAAIHGNTPMVRMLMHNGASVKRQYHGRSIAYIAASNGHPGTARYLVDQGGGKTEDIAQGRALYAENSERQRKQTQAFTALALTFVVAAIATSSDSGGSQDNHCEICGRYSGIHRMCAPCQSQRFQSFP